MATLGFAQAGNLVFDANGARIAELVWIVEDVDLNQTLDTTPKFAVDAAALVTVPCNCKSMTITPLQAR